MKRRATGWSSAFFIYQQGHPAGNGVLSAQPQIIGPAWFVYADLLGLAVFDLF